MRLLRTMILALAVLMTGTAVAQKEIKNFANMKVAKQGTTEYEAQRQAAVQAIDSILYICGHDSINRKRFKKTFPIDDIGKFIDGVCEKFKNDPILLDSVARAYYRFYVNEELSKQRYWTLKKLYPDYKEAFLSEARMYHNAAWYWDNDLQKYAYRTDLLSKSKEQIDSAKIVMPQSSEPYMLWFRLQAEFDPSLAYTELDTLKMRIPSYPGYLEAAQYCEKLVKAKNDRSYLLNARDCYNKAKLEIMKPNNLVDYASVCYEVNQLEDINRGIEVMDFAIKNYPSYPYSYRFKFWLHGKLEQWDEAIATANTFFEKKDTISDLFSDYKWLAMAYYNKKQYSEAIQNYKRELAVGMKDSIENALAMRTLVDCYTKLENYDVAISSFSDFENFKRSKGMKVTFYDYSFLDNAYVFAAQDTIYAVSERLKNYHCADSVAILMGSISPEDIAWVDNRRLDIILGVIQAEEGELNITRPEVLEACERLEKTILAIPETERKGTDNYYLMNAFYYKMEHFIYTDKKQEAWEISDKIVGEMPWTSQLTDLHPNYAKTYESRLARAQNVNTAYAVYGKKKKR